MTRRTLGCGLVAACAVQLALLLPPASAQDAGQPQAGVDSASDAKWAIGKVKFTGYLDAYYSLNFNHPASQANQLHNFDLLANEPALSFAKVSLEYGPSPVGFRFDIGAGDSVRWFNGADPLKNNLMNHMLQAYGSLKIDRWRGLQLDFGKFYTSAGAELTETYTNFNYTRSLLYSFGPYYHFGVRATLPVNERFTAGVQAINGWNNVKDNNGGKSFGVTGSYQVSSKLSLANTFYFGPEKTDSNYGWRKFNDTVVSVKANDSTSAYFNFDYGVEKLDPLGPTATFYGLAAALQHKLNQRWALAGRSEFYKDADGFMTGVPQTLKEVTATLRYTPHPALMTYLEYRYDWSNQPYFDRGNQPGSVKNLHTAAIGMVLYLGPEL